MNILATILARAGSKGVKSKNMRDFLGWPIAYYTLAAFELFRERYGAQYGSFTLAVNTDAPELFAQLDATGVPYVKVARKESLAGDRVSKIDVVRDTLAVCEKAREKQYDLVLDMDLTSPLRKAADIKNVLDAALARPDCDIALTVTDARRNPYFNQLALQPDGLVKVAVASEYIARQQAPEIFDANASLYCYKPQFLKNSDAIFLKAKLAPSRMEDTAVLDIDCERDYELLQVLAQYFYMADSAFGEVAERVPLLAAK